MATIGLTGIGSYNLPETGVANGNGIIFSSINGQTSVLHPIQTQLQNPIQTIPNASPKPLQDTPVLSTNINNAIDFGTNNSPVNPPIAQVKPKPVKQKPNHSSSGFTFAPLLAAPSLPMPQQSGNDSAQQTYPAFSKPSINLAWSKPMQQPYHKCGITKYTNSRVVGGSIAQPGRVTTLKKQNFIHFNTKREQNNFKYKREFIYTSSSEWNYMNCR